MVILILLVEGMMLIIPAVYSCSGTAEASNIGRICLENSPQIKVFIIKWLNKKRDKIVRILALLLEGHDVRKGK